MASLHLVSCAVLPDCRLQAFDQRIRKCCDASAWHPDLINAGGEVAAHSAALRHTLTFGVMFNQFLEGVALPAYLRALTLAACSNLSFDGVMLSAYLQTLTFGDAFYQGLKDVTLSTCGHLLLIVFSSRVRTASRCQQTCRH